MKKYLFILLCTVFSVSLLSAQEISEKKEVAVFSLSYSEWSIPSGALAIVDQQVVEVIANLGRFSVKGLDFRLQAGDVQEFISLIKQANEANIEIDEKYRLGEATFTEADFNKLVGSFIIVIPSLTYYDSKVEDTDDGVNWEVELQTAFSLIKVENSSTIAQFSIDTYGSGETQQEATMNAAEAISSQLDFRLRSIEEFRLKSGIIEILPAGNVILQLGADMGIERGDEFSIVHSTSLTTGQTFTENTGLIVISEVKKEVSFGHVIYNNKPLKPGDQLAEIPRTGMDFSAYADVFISSTGITGGVGGVKAVMARGFYDMRPFAGIEVPITSASISEGWPGLPASIYIGGELFWLWGRLQIEPSIAIGGTGIVPLDDSEDFMLSHFGGKAEATINWMLSDSLRLFINGGYAQWVSVIPSLISSYGGIFGGIGVTFKL